MILTISIMCADGLAMQGIFFSIWCYKYIFILLKMNPTRQGLSQLLKYEFYVYFVNQLFHPTIFVIFKKNFQ